MMHQQIIDVLSRLATVAESLRQPVTLAELSELAGVSQRTIIRDLKELESLGAPIRARIKPYTYQLSKRWSFWKALQQAAKPSED